MSVDIKSLKKIEELLELIDSKKIELDSLNKEFTSLEGLSNSQESQAKEKALSKVKNDLIKSSNTQEVKQIEKEALKYKKDLYSSVSNSVSDYLDSQDFINYLAKVTSKLDNAIIECDSRYISLLPEGVKINEKENVLRFWQGNLAYDFTPEKLKSDLVKKLIIKNLAKTK